MHHASGKIVFNDAYNCGRIRLIESKDWMDQLEKEHDPLVSTGKEYMPKKMHPDNHRPRNPAAVRESFHLPASFSFSFGSCNLFFSIDANVRTNV